MFRFPFLLVDRVVEYNPGVSAVGIKNVTINDNFFPGHFPERPIMPGVLMVEEANWGFVRWDGFSRVVIWVVGLVLGISGKWWWCRSGAGELVYGFNVRRGGGVIQVPARCGESGDGRWIWGWKAAMAQVGGLVMLQPEIGGSRENFFFAGIDKVRFRKPVIAGDTLVMRMTLTKLQKRFGIAKMEGKAYVGGEVVCEGEFLMAMGTSSE
ncbi:hypothetical protein KSS87_008020 [Heliosperma pusillum]|nr:hypothetical protein KSS87_008020 [Heliosperma pusillum]